MVTVSQWQVQREIWPVKSSSDIAFGSRSAARVRAGNYAWRVRVLPVPQLRPCSAGCFGVRPAGTLAGSEVPARLRAFDIRGRIVAVTVCSPRRAARARATFVKRGHSNVSAACGGKVEGDAAFETPTANDHGLCDSWSCTATRYFHATSKPNRCDPYATLQDF